MLWHLLFIGQLYDGLVSCTSLHELEMALALTALLLESPHGEARVDTTARRIRAGSLSRTVARTRR